MIAALRTRLADALPPREEWPAMAASYGLMLAAFAAVIAAKLP